MGKGGGGRWRRVGAVSFSSLLLSAFSFLLSCTILEKTFKGRVPKPQSQYVSVKGHRQDVFKDGVCGIFLTEKRDKPPLRKA